MRTAQWCPLRCLSPGTRTAFGFFDRDFHHRTDGGAGTGSLEDFALLVNGTTRVTAADRNIWGVTFVPGEATRFMPRRRHRAASGWSRAACRRARSRLSTTASSARQFSRRQPVSRTRRTPAGAGPALEGRRPGPGHRQRNCLSEPRSVDDQIEWLDDRTLLYGLARDGAAGDSDIWQIRADPASVPRSTSSTPGLRPWSASTPSPVAQTEAPVARQYPVAASPVARSPAAVAAPRFLRPLRESASLGQGASVCGWNPRQP